MGLTDRISTLIFALIVIAVIVYVIMSRFVIGPAANLLPGEKIILAVSAAGIVGVMLYAATELLLRVVL